MTSDRTGSSQISGCASHEIALMQIQREALRAVAGLALACDSRISHLVGEGSRRTRLCSLSQYRSAGISRHFSAQR